MKSIAIKQILSLVAVFMLFTISLYAQVGIGTTSPDPQAALDVQATDKGVLIPRVADHTTISATANSDHGLMVYNTTTKSFWYWKGAAWSEVQQTSSVYDNSYQKFGSGTITITSDSYQIIPNLTQTVVLTKPAKVLISTDGGFHSTALYDRARGIIRFFQNGSVLPDAAVRILRTPVGVWTGLVTGTANWSFNVLISLPAGTYTWDVRARRYGGQSYIASGNTNSVRQGQLNIIVYYQ